jgi:hypothetical protein
MAQQSGANARLIFDTETVYKTTPTPDAMVFPFISESLSLDRAFSQSKTIRSNRNPQKPGRGNMNVAGDIAFELSPQNIGRLGKHIFGSYGVVGSAAPYTHTYKIAALPVGMCIEKQFTDLAVPKYFLYNGCKVGSFKMGTKPDGIIEAGVSIIGAKETIGAATFDATATDNGHTPFDGFEVSIKEGGSALGTGTDFNFSLANNLDDNSYVIDGTGQRYSCPDGAAVVEGSVTCLFLDDVLLAKAIAHTETALELHLTKGAGTGASAGNEKLSFYFDEVVFKPKSPVVPGPTGLVVELGFTAYYNVDADASAIRSVLLSPIATF